MRAQPSAHISESKSWYSYCSLLNCKLYARIFFLVLTEVISGHFSCNVRHSTP